MTAKTEAGLTLEFAESALKGWRALALVGAIWLDGYAETIVLALVLVTRIRTLLIILVLIEAAARGHFVPNPRRLEEV